MEINHYGDTIKGVIASTDLVEGRMICLTSHSFDNDYGSDVDVPGAKYASTDAEKTRARYVITWAQDNRQTPLYSPGRAAPGTNPHFDNALRYGWDQAANAPFSATVYLTHPGQQEGHIPSVPKHLLLVKVSILFHLVNILIVLLYELLVHN
jgi:hypothetical protein